MRRSWQCVPLAAAAVVLTATACGSSGGSRGGKTIVFTNFAAAETGTRPGIEAVIAAFERSHPGVTVKSEPIPLTDMAHTLQLRAQAGNLPDVAEVEGNDTYTVAATGALQPLDGLASRSYRDALAPQRLASGRIGGKFVAAPFYNDDVGLWFNRDLMRRAGLDPNRPPATTDELLRDLAVIKKKLPTVIGLGLDTSSRTFALGVDWAWLKTFGAQPYDRAGKPTADTAAMRAFLTFIRALHRGGFIEAGHKIGDFRPLAARGEVAFSWDQPLFAKEVMAANHQTAAQFSATWGVAAQPTGSTGKSYTVDQGAQLVMFAAAKNKPLAWQFIRFLSSDPESALKFSLPYESALPPQRQRTGRLAAAADTPVFRAYARNVAPGEVVPAYGQHFADAYAPVMAGVQSAISGSTPVARIAATMQSQLESAFS